MSRAWMPMYWADYKSDTAHLSRDEHGGYMLLIAHYWHTGSLPDDDERLARITLCQSQCEWHALRNALEPFFEDGWKHKRIDAELAKAEEAYKKRALASEKAHAARWGKNANGNANRMPMACQSQSQSQSYNINTLVKADAVDEPVSDFKKLKRARDEKNTDLIQTIAGSWNDLAAELKLPQVVHITPARQSSILRRAKELVEYYDYPDEIAGFTALFSKIRGSPFLRGETGKFRADLDFAINQSSFTKIMENRYESVKKLENTFRR